MVINISQGTPSKHCLQCFDAVGWAAGRASGLEKLSGEVLAWLSVRSEVQSNDDCLEDHLDRVAALPYYYYTTSV